MNNNQGLSTIVKSGYKLGIFSSGKILIYKSITREDGRIDYVVFDKKYSLDVMPQKVFDELSDFLINYNNSKK
jgi:hypothetical protein